MRSPTEPLAGLAALLVFVTACSTLAPSLAPSPTPSTASSPSVEPSASAPVRPGHPYDAALILAAMRGSTRPDGVPEVLQTDAVASALADAIWTFDGTPWDTLAIEGSCAVTCNLEVAGARDATVGEDLWVFTVDPATTEVTVEETALAAVPIDVAAMLDDLARQVVTPSALDEMRVTNVAWLPPPADSNFVLSYRTGGEEGSCAAEVTIDAVSRQLVDERYTDC